GSVALLTGFVAKEIVVSTLGILYVAEANEDTDALRKALAASDMTSLSALSMMIFVLLYLPCLATISTIKQETGSFGWMYFSIIYSTVLAWVAAFCVYQGGRVLGFT
ncbi:nucleoside recognition domain-containing protein, partial [Thermodesulfobacteriota bacterium]